MKKYVLGAVVVAALALIIQTTFPHSLKSGDPISATSVTYPQISTNLSIGSTGDDVLTLQFFLASKGLLATSTPEFRAEMGRFGSTTYTSVRAFQVQNSISPVDGQVGVTTRNIINSMIAASFGTTTSAPQQSLQTLQKTLVKNATGTDVVLLQSFLRGHGWLSGGAYGIFDTETENAVLRFQTTFSIEPANGYVGTSTRLYINASINGSVTSTTTPATTTPTISTGCKKVAVIGQYEFYLNPCSINATLNDNDRNKGFEIGIVSNSPTVTFGYSIENTDELMKATTGVSSGTGKGGLTVVKRIFNSSLLNTPQRKSKIYNGQFKIRIYVLGNPTESVYLYAPVTLRVR